MSDLTAPNEGTASSPEAIADELCEALLAIDHIDYNALPVEELRELLEARGTVDELCLRYRRQQTPHAAHDGQEVTATDE